jgi:hypothetical protein
MKTVVISIFALTTEKLSNNALKDFNGIVFKVFVIGKKMLDACHPGNICDLFRPKMEMSRILAMEKVMFHIQTVAMNI